MRALGAATASLPDKMLHPIKGKVAEIVRRQQKQGGEVVMEAAAKYWPTNLRQPSVQIFTCGLGGEFCQEYKLQSVPQKLPVQCQCGSNGEKVPQKTAGKVAVYGAVCRYVHNLSNPEPPPGAVPAANTALSRDNGPAVHCPQAEPAYPTDAAIRQKQAKEKKKKQLEDVGCTKEEARAVVKKRKPQAQEKHFDDCGSDVAP